MSHRQVENDRLEVRSVDKGVPPGRYEIKEEEKHERAASDEERLSAQRVFTEGTRLFGKQDCKSAIEKYQEALRLYRKLTRRVEDAVSLNCLARASVGIYEYQAAIKFYENAFAHPHYWAPFILIGNWK